MDEKKKVVKTKATQEAYDGMEYDEKHPEKGAARDVNADVYNTSVYDGTKDHRMKPTDK